MASKRRLRRKQCENKVQYQTEAKAMSARFSLIRDKGETNLSIYKCQFCSQFHVGHTPAKIRQVIRANRERRVTSTLADKL